jgi:SAM-dependent methyltransferase
MIIESKSQMFLELTDFQSKERDNFLVDSSIEHEILETCPLCGGKDFQLVASFDRYKIPLDTVICSTCDLIYSKQQLTVNSTKHFYDKYYRKIYEGIPKASLSHRYYQKLYSGWVPRVPAFIKPADTVLEFGCGGGWNLLPYKNRGLVHFGYDYDSDMIQFGRKNYDLNLREGGLEEAILHGVKANYVIISQVLEHLKDPIGFLEQLKDCLHDNALVCITVPCVDYMVYFGGNSTHFSLDINLQNAHNFFFSERTLDLLYSKTGYQPLIILGGYALVCQGASKDRFVDHDSGRKLLMSIYSAQSLKIFISRFLPGWVIDKVLARLFYVVRPLKTLKWIAINRFGFYLS